MNAVHAYLSGAQRHVAQGERHIARRKDIIRGLRDYGRDTVQAEDLLCLFEAFQALHIADRDRLRAKIDPPLGSVKPCGAG